MFLFGYFNGFSIGGLRYEKFDVLSLVRPRWDFTALELNKQNPNCKILIIDKGRNIEKGFARKNSRLLQSVCRLWYYLWLSGACLFRWKIKSFPEVGGRITEYMSQQEAQDLINYADQYYLNFGASPDVYGLNNQVIDDISYEASKYDIKLILVRSAFGNGTCLSSLKSHVPFSNRKEIFIFGS